MAEIENFRWKKVFDLLTSMCAHEIMVRLDLPHNYHKSEKKKKCIACPQSIPRPDRPFHNIKAIKFVERPKLRCQIHRSSSGVVLKF